MVSFVVVLVKDEALSLCLLVDGWIALDYWALRFVFWLGLCVPYALWMRQWTTGIINYAFVLWMPKHWKQQSRKEKLRNKNDGTWRFHFSGDSSLHIHLRLYLLMGKRFPTDQRFLDSVKSEKKKLRFRRHHVWRKDITEMTKCLCIGTKYGNYSPNVKQKFSFR